MSGKVDVGTIYIGLDNYGKRLPKEYQPHVVIEITKRRPLVIEEHQIIGENKIKPFGGTATRRNIGPIIGKMSLEKLNIAIENRLK